MRIGIDARMYGSHQTGIGNYIRHLVDGLARIDQTNEYVVFLKKEAFEQLSIPSTQFSKHLTDIHWYTLAEQVRLPGILKAQKLDLVHFPHFNTPILYRGKTVTTIHDTTPFTFPGHKVGASRFRQLAYNAVFNNSIEHASRLIAVSQATKQAVLERAKVNPDKIAVTYLGVDNSFSQEPSQQQIRDLTKKHGLNKPFFLYIGIWRNHKNVDGLIRAYSQFREKYGHDIALVIGGKEDPSYPEVLRAKEESKCKHDILMTGFIPDKQLPLWYRAAKALVHVSFSEGNALPGLESMTCGTPVLASSIPALEEVLGEAAIYADPGSSEAITKQMHQLVSDSTLEQELIKKGHAQASHYSWDTTARQTLDIYKKVLR